MNPNKILIRKPFNEQYTLEIESDTKAVTAHMTSKIRIRWDLSVLTVNEKEIECRLIKTDHILVDSNNPMIKEVTAVSEVFGRMYNEVHAKINQKGEVLEVLNTDLILSKWEQTKLQMRNKIKSNPDLEQAISLNDTIYNDPEKVKIAVQAQEFFYAYFGHYFNEPLPLKKKTMAGKNLFATANLLWSFKIKPSKALHHSLENVSVGSLAMPASAFSTGYNNAAYGQFKDQIDIKSLRPRLKEFSEHKIHYPSGRLLTAKIEKEEIVKEKELYMKLKYTLKADSAKQQQSQAKKMSFLVEDENKTEGSNKEKGFFIEERPVKT